jgi:phage terminase Nu1 subunit (DNA packaging protein)
MDGINANKKYFADIIGKSPKWVSVLIDEGMPANGGGRGRSVEINTAAAINWIIDREISKKLGDANEEPSSEDIKLKRVRREEIELRIAERRRDLAPVSGFEDIALRIAGVYASQLDGLSSRVAGELAAIDDPAEIRAYLHDETRQIRAATAQQIMVEVRQLSEESDQLLSDSGCDDSFSTSDEDGE